MANKHPSAQHRCHLSFALGGLAGGNSFGAGFLAAMAERKIKPDLISCTSGMIRNTAKFLRGVDLEADLAAYLKTQDPLPPPLSALNGLVVSATGMQGVFSPAYQEYWKRWNHIPASFNDLADQLLPSQVWVPEGTKEDFDDVAKALTDTDVGVMLNGYEPQTATEFLYVNEKALELTGIDTIEGRRVELITGEGIENALWLTQYGFDREDGREQSIIDGAYRRSFIIEELTGSDHIFVARPENRK